jgi:hypothetical protein
VCRQRRLNPGGERRQLGRGVLGVAEAGPLAGEVEDAAGPVVVAAPSWSPPLQALAINVTAATTASRVAVRRALPAPPREGIGFPDTATRRLRDHMPMDAAVLRAARVAAATRRAGAGMGGSCGDRRNVQSTPITNTLVGQPVTFAWSARSLRLPGLVAGSAARVIPRGNQPPEMTPALARWPTASRRATGSSAPRLRAVSAVSAPSFRRPWRRRSAAADPRSHSRRADGRSEAAPRRVGT